jgi:hypothetical protein
MCLNSSLNFTNFIWLLEITFRDVIMVSRLLSSLFVECYLISNEGVEFSR